MKGQDDGNHSSSVKDHYRILYFEDFNFAISSIKEHFDQPGYVLYQNLKDLLLKAAKNNDYSAELHDFSESELLTQLQIFTSSFNEQHHSNFTLQDIISFLKACQKDNISSTRSFVGFFISF